MGKAKLFQKLFRWGRKARERLVREETLYVVRFLRLRSKHDLAERILRGEHRR